MTLTWITSDSMTNLEKIRNTLIEDADFLSWCDDEFGSKPIIVVGDDEANREHFETQVPVISILSWGDNRGHNQKNLQYNAVIHCGIHNTSRIKYNEGINDYVFTGSGLDDLTLSGDYTDTTIRKYTIVIDTLGNPNGVRWSRDGGITWYNGSLGIMPDPTPIGFGVYMSFGADTGHTLDDQWDFYCFPAPCITYAGMIQVEQLRAQTEAAIFKANLFHPQTSVEGAYDDTSIHPWHESYSNFTYQNVKSSRSSLT